MSVFLLFLVYPRVDYTYINTSDRADRTPQMKTSLLNVGMPHRCNIRLQRSSQRDQRYKKSAPALYIVEDGTRLLLTTTAT